MVAALVPPVALFALAHEAEHAQRDARDVDWLWRVGQAVAGRAIGEQCTDIQAVA